MSIRHTRILFLTTIALAGLLVAGCTRSVASNPLPTVTEQGDPAPDGGLTGAEATMDAVRSVILTQTAAAAEGLGGGGEGVTPTPAPTGTPVPTVTPTPATPSTYVVQPGDWMFAIARKLGVDPDALIAANPGVDPNYIEPGMVLNVPAPGSAPVASGSGTPVANPGTYTVQQGEWVYSIARKFGVDPNAIIQANNLQPPNYTVYPGQVLTIP